MKRRCLCSLLIAVTCLSSAWAKEDYWKCISQDAAKSKWLGFSNFEKPAKQKALDACKKASAVPHTCKLSTKLCVPPFASVSGQEATWQCTAFDRNGDPWLSNRYASRDEAAVAADAYCRSKSDIPHTCYVNTVTCEKRSAL